MMIERHEMLPTCILSRNDSYSVKITNIMMISMTYGILEKIIKHFEETKAAIQAEILEISVKLTGHFFDFLTPTG